MKHKKIMMILIFIVGAVIFLFYHYMWDTQSIPKGEMIGKINSPKNSYCAYVYQGTGGATVDYSTIVEVENNKTHRKKIIYFQYRQEHVDVKWVNDKKIKIGKKELNVLKDVYDSRH